MLRSTLFSADLLCRFFAAGKKFLRWIVFALFLFLFNSSPTQGQEVSDTAFYSSLTAYIPKLCVKSIVVSGNKRTKDHIILRELHFKPGDSIVISNLNKELEMAREFIYNTTLFVNVKVSSQITSSTNLDIFIEVKERWYIFPIPYFELADRSFNEWIDKYNAGFDRLSYGIRFFHFNLSGRKDPFSLTLINGFKRNISFDYALPYANRAMTSGFRIGAGYFQTREIPYVTDYNNNLIYFKNENFVKNEWYVKAAYTLRKALKKKETFQVTLRHIQLDDSIVSFKNPQYFNTNSGKENFVELEYKMQYNNADNILYPLKGTTAKYSIKKQGLGWNAGINKFTVSGDLNQYFPLGKGWFSSVRLSGEMSLPFNQPYYNQKAIGYEQNYLRGYEKFVIDGVAFAFAKLDLKKRMASFSIPTFINSKTYNKFPFTLYAKTFGDAGYVYNQPRFESRLNNRLLFSGGFGLDIVTLYDFKISVECSLNQFNQNGLFLHN